MIHTKGEWKIERVPIQSMGGSNTCFKIGPFEACIYDDWRQYQERGITTKEIESNAKLMAAAPEMLEALQGAINLLDLWGAGQYGTVSADHEGEMQALTKMEFMIRKAINKATI